MYRKAVLKVIVVLILAAAVAITSLTSVFPARAASATVSRFYATCNFFSVDVSVRGVTDDGGGFDRLRYVITDGSGKVLYQEDSARQVNVTDAAFVINLPYNVSGEPAANPIKFTVVDLDAANRPVGALQEIVYDASCLVASGAKVASDDFSALPSVKGKTTAATTLYYGPGSDMATNLTAAEGSDLSAVYRSADSQWIGVLVSPKHMVWIPASSINVDPFVLPIQPQRIDPSQNVTGAVVPLAPVATARAVYTVRLRSAPTTVSLTIARIPFNTTISVYGRNASGTWLLVSYGSFTGWVSAAYVRLNGVARLALPVVR